MRVVYFLPVSSSRITEPFPECGVAPIHCDAQSCSWIIELVPGEVAGDMGMVGGVGAENFLPLHRNETPEPSQPSNRPNHRNTLRPNPKTSHPNGEMVRRRGKKYFAPYGKMVFGRGRNFSAPTKNETPEPSQPSQSSEPPIPNPNQNKF